MLGLLYYAPVWRDYVWQALVEFRKDNVQYLEIRDIIPEVI